jgi:hypothetical protein
VYRLVLLASLTVLIYAEIPGEILAEKAFDKRAELALKEADEEISAAAKSYSEGGDIKAFRSHVGAVSELVEFTLKSLQDSGMRGGKRTKNFKRAELKMRNLLRRLETLEIQVSADDRPPVEQAQKVVSEAREHVLYDIMSKR